MQKKSWIVVLLDRTGTRFLRNIISQSLSMSSSPRSRNARTNDFWQSKPLARLSAVLLVAASPSLALATLSPEQSAAIVRIEVPVQGGTSPRVGTGFVVAGNSPRNYVITARHVLIDAPSTSPSTQCVDVPIGIALKLGNTGGDSIIPRCVHHLSYDVSLIELVPRSLTSPYPTLVLSARQIKAFDIYALAGFPLSLDLDTTRSGKITGSTGPNPMLVATIPTAPGMSGGPYTQEDGSVVAIHHGQASQGPGSAFIIPVAALRAQLENFLPPIPSTIAPAGEVREIQKTAQPPGVLSAAMALQDVSDVDLRITIFRKLYPDLEVVGPEWEELLRRLPSSPRMPPPTVKVALKEEEPILRTAIARRATDKRRACLAAGLTISKGLLYCEGADLLVPSPNYAPSNDPRLVVLHTTGSGNIDAAISFLSSTQARASAHVLIDRDGTFVQLVNFRDSAWHAGNGTWEGMSDLNRRSIGIQLVNWGKLLKATNGSYLTSAGREVPASEVQQINNDYWHRFTPQQMQTLQSVLGIVAKNYPIKNVIGHCETAPDRRGDPGPLLPVAQLESESLGGAQRPYQCAASVELNAEPQRVFIREVAFTRAQNAR